MKEELRVKILEVAEKEFLENGFDKASLRNIAKCSGTTIGNIYHYFDNKEALFTALVKGEYQAFLHLMEHNKNPDIIHYDKEQGESVPWREVFRKNLSSMMPIFSVKFLLLIDCSGNTKYGSAKQQVLIMIEEHIQSHMRELGMQASPGFEAALAQQLLAGLLYIIRTCEDDSRKHLLISDMFAFYMAGLLHFS